MVLRNEVVFGVGPILYWRGGGGILCFGHSLNLLAKADVRDRYSL